jgi:translation initiation factor IF-3
MGPRVNERIRVPEILIITETGEKLGPMSPREGVELARSKGLDLIEVAPTARPPVCRIAEYGKYKYDLRKKEREAARKQRQSSLKEMTLTPRIDDHDLEMKTKNILKFLADGDKVKVTVRFKSREMSHPEFAYAALNKITAAMTEAAVGVVERPPIMEGRQMILILSPQSAGGAKKPAPKPAAPKPATSRPAPANAAPTASNGEAVTNGEADTAAPVEPVQESSSPATASAPAVNVAAPEEVVVPAEVTAPAG